MNELENRLIFLETQCLKHTKENEIRDTTNFDEQLKSSSAFQELNNAVQDLQKTRAEDKEAIQDLQNTQRQLYNEFTSFKESQKLALEMQQRVENKVNQSNFYSELILKHLKIPIGQDDNNGMDGVDSSSHAEIAQHNS